MKSQDGIIAIAMDKKSPAAKAGLKVGDTINLTILRDEKVILVAFEAVEQY